MAVQPIDWNAGGNVSLGDLYIGRQVRNQERRTDAYERMADAQAAAMEESQRRKAVAEQADWIIRSGGAILQAPPDQRPGLYAQVLEDGRARGYDVSRLPPQYDAATEGYIRFNVDKVRAFMRQPGRGRGGAPAAGGGGGMALDPPYQPPGASPPDAAVAPPAQQPAPAAAPPGGVVPPGPVAPRQPIGAPAVPGRAPVGTAPMGDPGAMPGDAPVGPAPGAVPPQTQAGPAPSVTLRMPQMAPPPAPAGPPPSPVQPVRDDSGQDPAASGGIPAPAPPGPALEPGDRIVRGRGGAVRTVNGMIEVRDKNGQTQFRPMVRPQAPRAAPKSMVDIVDPNTGRVIAQRDSRDDTLKIIDPDAMKGGKPLDNSARDDLRKAGATSKELTALDRDWNPKYGGYKREFFGDLDNSWGRTFGDSTGQAQWWQRYAATANIIRNNLFGATLTEGERKAFDAAMINPGMHPEEIRKNLARQTAIARGAISRESRSMAVGGYNREQIETLIGTKLKDLPDPFEDVPTSPPPGDQPKRLKYNPATRELE